MTSVKSVLTIDCTLTGITVVTTGHMGVIPLVSILVLVRQFKYDLLHKSSCKSSTVKIIFPDYNVGCMCVAIIVSQYLLFSHTGTAFSPVKLGLFAMPLPRFHLAADKWWVENPRNCGVCNGMTAALATL